MNRRDTVLALLALAAAPVVSLAQQPMSRMRRIGLLGATTAVGIASRLAAFRAGMSDLGYVEGKNLMIEFRWAEGKYDRLPELAAELVRLNVELIVTGGTPGVLAAKHATTSIPIVIAAQADSVASGIVISLARPGGNITGSSFFGSEILAKRLEWIKEVLPQIRRIGFLANSGTAPRPQQAFKVMNVTAKSLNVELESFEVSRPEEFERVFSDMVRRRVSAVAVQEEGMLTANATLIASMAARNRIAAIGSIEFAEVGCLMGYGPDGPALYRRAAVFADKILKGAKPGDLPIEQPTTFELVINRKTAKTLGIKIPPSILVRADRVIE